MKLSKYLKKKLSLIDEEASKTADIIELSDITSEDTHLSSQVLLSLDILSTIFKQLSAGYPSGLNNAEITRYALVCKTWREASQELPVVLDIKKPLEPQQQVALMETEKRISAMTFAEGDAAAAQILQHPDFCRKQGRHMGGLAKICDITDSGQALSLKGFPNLRTLFFNSDPRIDGLQQILQPQFDSSCIAYLSKLETLSLRGYHTINLTALPLSTQTLYVGRAGLVKRPVQPSEGELDAVPPLSNSPFPKGLALKQVILNCQRGGWLGEPLSHYLAVAQQVTFYGRTLLVRNPPEDACRLLTAHIDSGPVQRLELEFDIISVIRIAPGGGEAQEDYRWHCYEYGASDLGKLLRDLLPSHKVQLVRGRLFQHSFTITRRQGA